MSGDTDILDGVLDLFQELVWDNLVKAALADLFLAVPLLGWGPIGYVITYLAMAYSDRLYKGVRIFVNVKDIAFANDDLGREYNATSVQLRILAKSYGIASKEFEEAREKNKERMSKFIRFDVAR